MQKIKTHKASAKRFSLTKNGKVKMNHSQHRHKLGIKTAKRIHGSCHQDADPEVLIDFEV